MALMFDPIQDGTSGNRGDPARRIVRHTIGGPALQCFRVGIVQAILCCVKRSELSHQAGEKTASVAPVQGIKGLEKHGFPRKLKLR